MKRYQKLMEMWEPDEEVKTANVDPPDSCTDMSQDNTECKEDTPKVDKKKGYPSMGTIG